MAESYPLPAFHFVVDWAGTNVGFTEVTGLTYEIQAIEYRAGSSAEFFVTKMPGLQKFNNITLKRGVFKRDNEFFIWLNTVKQSTIERRDITIKLLDENGTPVMIWSVKQAFPVKLEGPSFKSSSNEAAIESIELAHEGFSIAVA
jgi:phage tail-like protein